MPNATNVLVVFYSRTGTVASLGEAVADGARSAGADVRIRRAREVVGPETMALAPGWQESADRLNALYPAPTEEDMLWADGIVFGTPTRFGMIASELKAFLDGLGRLWATGGLDLRVGSVFSSTATRHGGNESTITSLYPLLAHFGMVIVPAGYADPVMLKAGTPYGATAYVGTPARPVDNDELAAAHYQGQRVARVASALKAVRSS
jgi:NAD(P)H dehydrogenase (quinone)